MFKKLFCKHSYTFVKEVEYLPDNYNQTNNNYPIYSKRFYICCKCLKLKVIKL